MKPLIERYLRTVNFGEELLLLVYTVEIRRSFNDSLQSSFSLVPKPGRIGGRTITTSDSARHHYKFMTLVPRRRRCIYLYSLDQ